MNSVETYFALRIAIYILVPIIILIIIIALAEIVSKLNKIRKLIGETNIILREIYKENIKKNSNEQH